MIGFGLAAIGADRVTNGERGGGYVTVGPDGRPARDAADAAGPVDLALYSAPMLRRWEVTHAHVAAAVFEAWLLDLARRYRVPAKAAEVPVTFLWLWVECELVDRAMHPDEFDAAEEEDDGPRSEGDAAAHGLSVVAAPARERLPAAIHPGCQRAKMIDGVRCDRLRRYGERLCPACSREWLRGRRRAAA